MDPILFIILVAVAGLLRWLAQRAGQSKDDSGIERPGQSQDEPALPRETLTEEERVRRFLEALGVPTSSVPPPKVEPRPQRTFVPQTPPIPQMFPIPRPRVEPARPTVFVPGSPVPPKVKEIISEPPPLPQRPTWERPLLVSELVPAATAITQPVARGDVATTEAIDDIWERPDALVDATPVPSRQQPDTIPASLALRLATEQGLRDAIILREIFGPPRSMQPLQPLRF